MTANGPHGVAVVGSANLDIVVTLDRNPNPGETVFGRDYAETPGGKGANQAITADALSRADPLIVNDNEARAILEPPGADQCSKSDLARALLSVARSVVLTAGGEGAFVAEHHMVTCIPGLQVTVVDTTGAGDEFAGSLAAHLSLGTPLLKAAAAANAAAAQIVWLRRAAR